MYSKVYWITCDEGQEDALLSHYDTVVTPLIRESPHHVGHHMIEVEKGKWILLSNYTGGGAADEATSLVRDLVGGMSEKFGVKLDIIGEGDVTREIA